MLRNDIWLYFIFLWHVKRFDRPDLRILLICMYFSPALGQVTPSRLDGLWNQMQHALQAIFDFKAFELAG